MGYRGKQTTVHDLCEQPQTGICKHWVGFAHERLVLRILEGSDGSRGPQLGGHDQAGRVPLREGCAPG
jgi:hypothetical protein